MRHYFPSRGEFLEQQVVPRHLSHDCGKFDSFWNITMAKRSRTSHRNLTFLYTTSKQSCLRLWLALDDVMLIDNGCLWTKSAS